MAKEDPTIKIYHWLTKRDYFKGKKVYEYERIYIPVPTRVHDKIKPFLNQRLKMHITRQNEDLIITLHPVKTFLHAKTTPDKT